MKVTVHLQKSPRVIYIPVRASSRAAAQDRQQRKK
jgi:hypothetical protein